MAHYFTNFPSVEYDLGRTGFPRTIQNPLIRFKLLDILKGRSALYYEHIVEEGQSAQFIADNYYEDVTLDWVIYLINDVYDTLYDWPMDYQVFTEFLRSKYDSVEKALTTVHQYEHIIQKQTVLFDGTIVPEEFLVVDKTTFDGLGIDEKREVSKYTYEERLNDAKRSIKVLQRELLDQFLAEAESVLE